MGCSDLSKAGVVGPGYDAAPIQSWLSEVGVVESIEELPTELEPDAFADLEVLYCGKIPEVETRAQQNSIWRVAKGRRQPELS